MSEVLQLTDLPPEMGVQLKQQVYKLMSEAIEEARRDSKLDGEFLKKVAMAKWVGISFGKFDSLVKSSIIPYHYIEGIQLFSKTEVKQAIINYKK